MGKTFLAIVGALTLLAGTALVGQRLYAGFDPYAFWDDPTLVPLYARAELGDRAAQYILGLHYYYETDFDWLDNVNTDICGERAFYWLTRAYLNWSDEAETLLAQHRENKVGKYLTIWDESQYTDTSKRCW